MNIAVTGITGNVGKEFIKQILHVDFIDEIKLLLRSKNKKIMEICKDFSQKVEFIYGDMSNKDALEKLIDGVDIVINIAATIPPRSDKNPKAAIACNELGVYNLVDILEKNNPNCLLVHLSSVAVYGSRNEKHPFGRVGDPLLTSPGDIYSLTKMRGEYRILECNLKKWAILRIGAVLHDDLMRGNMNDGLMFHTCFNSPLEWVSARDISTMLRKVCIAENNKTLNDSFYRKIFNVGNKNNRYTGFEAMGVGFKVLLNADTVDFFEPNFNALRNFHGLWYADSDDLNNMFEFQVDTINGFWNEILNKNKIVKLGRTVPKKILKHFAIERLFKDSNSCRYWIDHNDEARITAYFYSLERYKSIPKTFDEFYIFSKDENFESIRNNPNYHRLDLGYDDTKKIEDITIDDLRNVALMHGGKLLSEEYNNNPYEKVKWQNQDGKIFEARPYTVLKGGHWLNESYHHLVWDFDRLSKKDKIFAQIWYDSHELDENNKYYFDEDFNLKISKNN